MSPAQAVITALLIAVLVGLAGYYGWRQRQTLQALSRDELFPPEDRRYLRGQVWRRLLSCALMVVFAAQLGGSFFIEGPIQDLIDLGDAAIARHEQPVLTEQQKPLVRLYLVYWSAALLVLLGLIVLALWDLLAIRRFGRRHFRQLQADRRAMIARQVAQFREERNGHNGSG